MRRLPIALCLLAMASCQAVPPGPSAVPPAPAARRTDLVLPVARANWNAVQEASPASEPGRVVPGPIRHHAPRQEHTIPDDRPSWLPGAPDDPERYTVPDEWYSDTIAALGSSLPA